MARLFFAICFVWMRVLEVATLFYESDVVQDLLSALNDVDVDGVLRLRVVWFAC